MRGQLWWLRDGGTRLSAQVEVQTRVPIFMLLMFISLPISKLTKKALRWDSLSSPENNTSSVRHGTWGSRSSKGQSIGEYEKLNSLIVYSLALEVLEELLNNSLRTAQEHLRSFKKLFKNSQEVLRLLDFEEILSRTIDNCPDLLTQTEC